MIAVKSSPLVMVEVTDPQDIARIKAQRERFRKNSDWLQVHVPQVYAQHDRRQIECLRRGRNALWRKKKSAN